MFLIPFILSAGLDMSLPEFQPEADASGNYIVSSYDVSENEFSVEYIPAEDFAEVSLSPSAEVLEAPIFRAIETHTIDASTKTNYRVSNGTIQAHSGDILYYIYLTAGIEYTIVSGSPNYYSSSLGKGAVCTSFSGSTITPESNIYLLRENQTFSVSYTTGEPDPEPEDPSGNDPDPEDPSGNDPDPEDPSGNDTENPSGGGSYDDVLLLQKIDRLINLIRASVFVGLMTFCYPLIIAIVNNIVGGDKNV